MNQQQPQQQLNEHSLSRRKRRNQNFTKLSKYFVSPNVVNRLGLLPPLIPVELRIPAPAPASVPSVSLSAVVEALTISESSPTSAVVLKEKNNNTTDDDHTTVKTFKSASLKSTGTVASVVRVSRAKSDQLLSQHSHSQDEDDMSLNSMLSMKSWASSQSRGSVISLYPNIRMIHGKLKARAIIYQRLPPTKPMVVFPRELLEAGDNNINYSRRGDLEVLPSQQPSSKSIRKIESVTAINEITSATTELPSYDDAGMTHELSNISSTDTAQKEAAVDATEVGVESESKIEKKKIKKVSSFDGAVSFSYKNQTSSGSRLFAPTAAALARMRTDLDKSSEDSETDQTYHHQPTNEKTHAATEVLSPTTMKKVPHEHVKRDTPNEHVRKESGASLEGSSRLLASIGKVKQVVEEETYVPKKRKHYRYFPPKIPPPKIQPPTKQNGSSIVVADDEEEEEEEEEEYDEWTTPDGQPWCPFCTMIFRNRMALDKHKFSRQHEIATGAYVGPVKEPEKIEVYEEGSHFKLLFSGQKFFTKPLNVNFNMDIYEHRTLPKSNIAVPFSILEIVLYEPREDYELPRIYLDLGPRLIKVVEKLELRAKEGSEFIRKEILRASKYGEEPDMVSICEQERCRVYSEFVTNGLRLIDTEKKEVSSSRTPQMSQNDKQPVRWRNVHSGLHSGQESSGNMTPDDRDFMDDDLSRSDHDKRTLELLYKAKNIVSSSNKGEHHDDKPRVISDAHKGSMPSLSPGLTNSREISVTSTPHPEIIVTPFQPRYRVIFESMDDPLYLKKTLNEQQFNELLSDMGVADLFDADGNGDISLNEIDGMFDEDGDGVVTLEELFEKIGRNEKLPSLVMNQVHPNLRPVHVTHTAVSKEGKAGLLALEEAFRKALEERSLQSSML